MDEQKTLTLDLIKSLMEPAYTLVWTDYDDSPDNHCGLIQKCLDSKDREHLWGEVDVWYNDTEQEAVHEIIAKLREECTVFNDFDKKDVDDFLGEHEDEIHDEICSRNNSDATKELMVHTDGIPIRVEMLSDYDYINSHWFGSRDGYRYEESYFGDMVDSLDFNPVRVKKIPIKHGYKAYGCFPGRKNRNGREQVSYGQFYGELISSCCGANLPTYVGGVNLRELYEAGFSLGEVVIPKSNCYELFSSTYDDGSPLEMELRKGIRLKLEAKDYRGFRSQLDDERSKHECFIRHVYGVDDSFFGEGVNFVAS